MSDFQAFATQRLAALTAMMNGFIANGKKIEELNPLDILNPSAQFHVSIDGVSYRVNIAQLISAISNANHDHIASMSGNIAVDEDVVTVPVLIWILSNIIYQTTSETNFTIPYCATGLNRKDIFVLNNNNEVLRIAGPEDADIIVTPTTPIGMLYLTEISVSDSTIGTPEDPVLGMQFVEKIEFLDQVISDDGAISIHVTDKSTSFILTGAVTQIEGFEMSTDFLNSDFYIGKEFRIENLTGGSFTFKHNGTSNLPALFPLEENFTVNDKEILIFKPQKFDQLGAKFISVNRTLFGIDAVSGLQDALDNKADLVSGKVPSSQLPSYVDDVIEVVNYAALPGTGETGKIYVTLDDNKQYRWSGSVYINFSGGDVYYFMRINVDGVSSVSQNVWYSFNKTTANYDNGAFIGSFGSGSSPTLSTLIASGIPVTPPKGTLLVEAYQRFTTMPSWGTATIQTEINSNETLDNTDIGTGTPNDNQLITVDSWTSTAGSTSRSQIKELSVQTHDPFTEFSELFLATRQTSISGSGIRAQEFLLLFKKVV